MIKYYSTLNDRLYDSELEAQKAEDKYVEAHFEGLRKIAKNKKFKRDETKISSKPIKVCMYKIQSTLD